MNGRQLLIEGPTVHGTKVLTAFSPLACEGPYTTGAVLNDFLIALIGPGVSL